MGGFQIDFATRTNGIMSEHFDPEAGQPLPITTKKSVDVAVEVADELKKVGLDSVAEDVEARIRIGERKYGKRLQSFNGREAVKDLYDEVLDAMNYSKQLEIEGRDDGSLFKQLVVIVAEVKSKL
jgi:hypothetical protein